MAKVSKKPAPAKAKKPKSARGDGPANLLSQPKMGITGPANFLGGKRKAGPAIGAPPVPPMPGPLGMMGGGM